MTAIRHISNADIMDALRAYDYAYFGLRAFSNLPTDGATLDASRVWANNEPTDEVLPGTSAIEVTPRTVQRALADIRCYSGCYIALLGADEIAGTGEDEGEILLLSPIVLERWTCAEVD